MGGRSGYDVDPGHPVHVYGTSRFHRQSYYNFLNVPNAWTTFFATDATYVYHYEREIYDMKKLKTYYVNSDDDNLVYKISFVEDPAIEQSFVYFGKEKPVYVSFENEERRMVYSPVLIPSFPIYRRYGNEEFNVVFEASAIEQLAHNYLRDGFQREWSRDHESDIKGVTTVESWIKTSNEDKSVALGLDPDLPIGTWFIAASIQSDEIWKKIKEGNWTGISVEALISLDDEIKLAKEDMTKEQNVQLETVEVNDSFWSKLVAIIKDALRSPEQAEEQAEAEAEAAVEDIKEDVVEEETPAEENLEEEVPVEEVAEDAAAAAEEVANENTSDPDEEKAALEETITKLEEKIDELNGEIEELKKQNQKLSKQPSTKEIKAGSNNRSQADTMAILRQLREGSYFKR